MTAFIIYAVCIVVGMFVWGWLCYRAGYKDSRARRKKKQPAAPRHTPMSDYYDEVLLRNAKKQLVRWRKSEPPKPYTWEAAANESATPTKEDRP